MNKDAHDEPLYRMHWHNVVDSPRFLDNFYDDRGLAYFWLAAPSIRGTILTVHAEKGVDHVIKLVGRHSQFPTAPFAEYRGTEFYDHLEEISGFHRIHPPTFSQFVRKILWTPIYWPRPLEEGIDWLDAPLKDVSAHYWMMNPEWPGSTRIIWHFAYDESINMLDKPHPPNLFEYDNFLDNRPGWKYAMILRPWNPYFQPRTSDDLKRYVNYWAGPGDQE